MIYKSSNGRVGKLNVKLQNSVHVVATFLCCKNFTHTHTKKKNLKKTYYFIKSN